MNNSIDVKDVINRAWEGYKLCSKNTEFKWGDFMRHLEKEVGYAKRVALMTDDMSVEDIKKLGAKEGECIRYLNGISSKTHTFYSICKMHYNLRYFVGSKWFRVEFNRAYAGVMRRINN